MIIISVIIPVMPIEPYKTMCKDATTALYNQTIRCEVIVSAQKVEPYINKGKLYNDGIKKAHGDVIWLCDADFIPEPTLLVRMLNKLTEGGVVYPKFYSEKHKQLKIADGGPMFEKKLLDDFGEFDETHLGISWVTFPFLNWCLRHGSFWTSDNLVVDINPAPQRKAGKRHQKTSNKLRPLYKETVSVLQKMGLYP